MKSQRIVLKECINFSNTSFDFSSKSQNYQRKFFTMATQVYQEIQSVVRESKSIECGKKVKLKLKTNPSRELQKRPQSFASLQKQNSQRFQDNSSGLKVISKKGQKTLNSNDKKKKTARNFKPNVVYFQLKSLKGNLKPYMETKKDNGELTDQFMKQKQKVKNYQLSSFLSQVVSKLAQIYPQIFNHQATLKTLQSQQFYYSDLMAILFSLGMIKYSEEQKYNINSEDQKAELQKVFCLWKILKLNQTQIQSQFSSEANINIINVITVLSVICNISFEDLEQLIHVLMEKIKTIPKKKIQPQENHRFNTQIIKKPNQIFFIRNKNLLKQFQITLLQGIHLFNPNRYIKAQITKEFQLFRVNRLKTQYCSKSVKEKILIQTADTEGIIQSLLSPKSQQLAMTRRLKILEEIQNSEENLLQKQENCQLQINFFLNYKKTPNCNHQNKALLSKELFSNNQKKQTQKTGPKQLTSASNKNQYIHSQRIKFSELNLVRNMQKARKMKLEKQIILQKGWTNSGQINSKLSQTQLKHQRNKKKNQGARSLQKSKDMTKSHSKRNFLQSRKNQTQLYNNQDILTYRNQAFNQRFENKTKKNYEKQQELIQHDQHGQDTFVQHSSDEDSNSTISINQLEPIELENRHFNNEYDFLMEDEDTFEKFNQILKIDDKKNNHNCAQQNSFDPESGSKTFRTQVNDEFEPQESGSNVVKKISLQNCPSQQTRIIKSYLKIPILYVDVNMDESKKERIIIYEQDNPTTLAREFGKKHQLDQLMVERLQQMLKQQISGILGRIDEEEQEEYDQTKENICTDLETDL